MRVSFSFLTFELGSRKHTVYVAKPYSGVALINSLLKDEQQTSGERDADKKLSIEPPSMS